MEVGSNPTSGLPASEAGGTGVERLDQGEEYGVNAF